MKTAVFVLLAVLALVLLTPLNMPFAANQQGPPGQPMIATNIESYIISTRTADRFNAVEIANFDLIGYEVSYPDFTGTYTMEEGLQICTAATPDIAVAATARSSPMDKQYVTMLATATDYNSRGWPHRGLTLPANPFNSGV